MSSKELTNAELTKKLKTVRRRLKEAEASIVTVTAANVALEEDVARQGKIQQKLMFNLRRLMTDAGLKPERPPS